MIGHADRVVPLKSVGLLMPGERKSVEPMAAVTAPAGVAAQHQLYCIVGNAPWSDETVLAKVSELVLPSLEAGGPMEVGSLTTRASPRRGGIRSG